MSLNIRPILSALLRNRTGGVLVALQIALALAILVNAAFVVKQRIDMLDAPTGVDEHNLFAIEFEGFTKGYNFETSLNEDLTYLRGLDGVISASASPSGSWRSASSTRWACCWPNISTGQR